MLDQALLATSSWDATFKVMGTKWAKQSFEERLRRFGVAQSFKKAAGLAVKQ